MEKEKTYEELLEAYENGDESVTVDMGEGELTCSNCIFSMNGTTECDGECMDGEDEYDMEDDFEFIWGMISYDDLTGNPPSLYTMNDIDIIRDKSTGRYFLDIETIYEFKKEIGKYLYIKGLLNGLDKFMDDNGYTKRELGFYETFCGPIMLTETQDGFESIEDLYAYHSSKFRGYLANFEEFHQDVIEEYKKERESKEEA